MEHAGRNKPIMDRLRIMVEEKHTPFAGCDARVATVRTASSDWGLLVGRFVFSDEDRGENSDWDYSWIRVTQKFLSVPEALALVEEVSLAGRLRFADLDMSLLGYLKDDEAYWSHQRRGYWPSDGSAFGVQWPAHMIQLVQNPQPQLSFHSGPLVTATLPLYPDFGRLLKDTIGHEVQGTTFMYNLVVLVPNYIARISTVRPGIRSLSVEVQPHPKATQPTLVKVFADVGQPLHAETEIPLGGKSWDLSLPSRPSQWEVALLDSQGHFLDSRSSWMSSVRGRAAPRDVRSADDVSALLEEIGGESDILEFKLMPKSDDAKRDLVETVVAFANTRGGIVLVGVDDHGRLVGTGSGGEADNLASMIRDRTDPPIKPEIYQVPTEPSPIYAINLPPSEQRPHQLWPQGTVYVRVGATDRVARMEEIRGLIQGRPHGINSST